MEQELGGEAAALLRQKRAALRRRGCSFESPRYRGQEGCGWEGQKRGAGHVWGVEVGGNRGLRGRGAGCGRWRGGLRVSGEEPGPSGGGSRGLEHTSGRCEGVTSEKNLASVGNPDQMRRPQSVGPMAGPEQSFGSRRNPSCGECPARRL